MRRRGASRGAASVVVIGVDDSGMGSIRECLGTEAMLPPTSAPYAAAITEVESARPDVVIMGFDGDPEEAVRLGPLLASVSQGLQMVAISAKAEPERIRAAMRAGYREYVVLPEDAHLLRQAVHESTLSAPDVEDQGTVIAVIGAKGGVGATFITVNLAAELSPIERVCVVDLDFSMGDVAALLDLNPRSSIHEVMQNVARLDERMLVGSVSVHRSKVHVLNQPNQLADMHSVRGDDVLRLLTVVADAYQYVLCDCGTVIDDATLTTMTVADMILVLCTPDVPSVKNAWRRLQFLDSLGIERDSIRLIVNKWDGKAELSRADIEKNLNIPVAATVARDDDACMKAVNAGDILRDVDKKSPTARDVSSLVSLLTEGVDRVEPETTKKSFGWLFRK